MGNQQIKSDFAQVQSTDFDDNLLNNYVQKLWSFEDGDDISYKEITGQILRVGDDSLEKEFPTQCTVEAFSHDKHGATEFNFIRETTYMAGFTSGEKKIDILRQEDIKQLRVENNAKAIEFESFVMGKIGILTAQLLSRHKGGESIDDWLEHAKKEEDSMGSQTAMGNLFSSILLCDINTIEVILKNATTFLKDVLETLLEQARGVEMGKFCETQDIKKLNKDLKLQKLRKLLNAIVRSNNSDKTMKTLAVRLMLRLGYAFATAEDMLMAAELQSEFKLDLTYDLVPLLDKSETFRKYIPPVKPGSSSGDSWSRTNENRLNDRVSFSGLHGASDQAHDADQSAGDGKFYYCWSHSRGLYRGHVRDHDKGWEPCDKAAPDVKDIYKQVTFVLIDSKIHIRSGHLENEPFAELDPETCKIKENFTPWTSEDNLLNWSKTDVQSTIGDSDTGFRYLRPTQMHYYDNELWIVAPYYTDAFDSPIKRLVVEVYQREGRHFTRINEKPLFKEDGITTFKGSKNRKHDYLNRGMLHKNALHIVFHSGKNIHVFDRQSGQRTHKSNHFSNTYMIFYNPAISRFHWMDIACYSYFNVFDLKDYDPTKQLVSSKEATQFVEPPIVLDEIKQAIKKLIIEVYHEDAKAPAENEQVEQDAKKTLKNRKRPTLHQIRALMNLDEEAAVQIAEVPSVSDKIENVHEKTKAIIYSFCGVEANYAMKAAQNRQESPPLGSEMLAFFKVPFSVYLNRDLIMFLRKRLHEEVQASFSKTQLLNQVIVFSLLHFIQASFLSIKCCRMRVQQILSAEDMLQFKDTIVALQKVQPPESSKGKKVEDFTKEEALQINIALLTKQVIKSLLSALDSLSSADKLKQISVGLNSSNPESVQQLMIQLSDRDSLTKLFSDTNDLKTLLPALNGCCFVVNQSIKRILNKALTLKEYAPDLDTDFASAASDLQSMLCRELCASYGDQLLTILTHKDKAQGSKPDSMEEEEWNKIQSKYNSAVEARKNLDNVLYHAFINISEHIKFQMGQLNLIVDELHAQTSQWTEDDLKNLSNFLKKIFSDPNSILRSGMFFSLFFSSFESDITWLDEIAEGLRHMTTVLNNSLLNLINIQLDSNPEFSLEDNKFVVFLQKVLRQLSYTIGWVAGRLIQRKQDEEEDSTLSKLNVLQGGIENRFIPGLSEPTKIQIEGSFKITGDKQLQKLALSDESAIVLEMDDKIFKSIVDNEDSAKLTLEVLHQSLLQKVPMCAFARLGGEDGSTISRAAFAAIIKFTDKTIDFEGLNNQVETIASGLTTSGVQKLKEIITQLKEQESEDYETLCKSWETANQMRKWTQQIKLTISENIRKQTEEAVRNEINEANPSAEPFTGPFNEEQKQIIEEKSNAKFDLELQKTYQGVVDKTRTLLKLQVPASYKQKREIKHAKPSLQSQVGNKLMAALQLKRKQTVIIIDRNENKTDKEYDWTDRLKQWKNVQMAQGAIVDLSAKGQLNSQSASLAILGLLQSEFTVDQINKTLEESLINGLRRSAGLNLLNYAMGLSGNSQIFFDMIQWFSASLRQRKNTSVHFLDGLTSCGNSCESGIRVQFFKILKKVDLKLRTCSDLDELKLLLNVLCWNFTADDHEQLSKLNIFETLHKGDGSELSWVKYNLGTYMYQCWNSKNNFIGFSATNIGRALQQTSEYLQNQVLASIIHTQDEVEVIESKQSQAKMITAQTTLNENASKIVVEQMSSMIWSNIERTVNNNRNQPCPDRNRDKNTIEERFTDSEMQNQDSRNTNCSVYADCISSRPDIKTLGEFDEVLNKRKKVELLKMRMLINLVDPSKNQFGVNDVVQTWLKDKAGPALGFRNIGQIIDHIKARDLVIQELLQRTTFEELSIKTPKTDEEKAAEAAAKAKEEAETAAAKAKAESEEAEAITKAEAKAKAEAQGEVIRAERQARADAGEETEQAPVEGEQPVPVPEGQDMSAYVTEKNCDACTFINSVDAVKCSCCDTPFKPETIRPVPVPPVKEQVKVEEISEDESLLNDHQKICKVIGKIGKIVSQESTTNQFQDFDKRRYFARGPQFRLLMQLEQLLGVAEKSAVINSLIQDSLHPLKIQLLIELSVTAHPTIGQLVQRIFQILLRMEVPQEIFESAIQACCRPDATGKPSEVEQLLARVSVLSFPQSKFLQLLVNSVQSVVEKTTKLNSYAQFDFWHTAIETTRTLRILQTFPNKNQALGSYFKAQLSQALLSIETKTDGEVETLVNLIGEMRIQNHFNIGQAVQNDEGDLYIVVDNENMNHQQSRRLAYFDPQQPERQQFVDGASDQVKQANKVSPQKLTPILDLYITETEEAARNSVLVQPDVISKLLDLVKDSEEKGVGSLSKLTVRSLQTSVTRGFMNLFKTLKLEYMQLLKSNNLFEKLISYLVHVSGESSFPFADQLRDLIQKEQHLQFKKQSWTSSEDSHSNTNVYWLQEYICTIPPKEQSSFNEEESKTKLSWKSCVTVQNLHGGDEGYKHYEDFPTIKEAAANEFVLPEITEIGIWYDGYVNGVSVFYKDGTSYERKGDSYQGQYKSLKMMKGEFVSIVHGRFGSWSDQLTIVTNYGRKLIAGGMGGCEQSPVYPTRTYVVGLDTHFHSHLTRVEVQYVNLDQLPWTKDEPLLNMMVQLKSAIIETSVFKYDSKTSKVTRDRKFDHIQFKDNYFRKSGKLNDNRSDSIVPLNPDFKSYFFDHIEGSNKLPGLMLSSETLHDMTPLTFYILGKGDTIFTDDQIPIEEVLQKMHESLANNKEEFKKFDTTSSTLADPQFIVLAKADFDRLKSSIDNTLSCSAHSSEQISTNEKCLFLNDISHRISVSMEKNENTHVQITLIAKKVAENFDKTVAEIIDLCIADDTTDEVKTLLLNLKDGAAFVPPVTEDKIEEAKDDLLINSVSDEIPNFSEMLLKSESVTNNCANELINNQLESTKYLDEFGSDFYSKEMGVGDHSKSRQQSQESLQQIYNLYKVVNQSICRNTLINIMEVAGNRINESAGMLLQQEELLTKLDDLLHNEHMVRSHQSFCYDDPKALKKSEEQTISVLKLFKETPSIKNFLVRDFFKRAKETILKISKNDFDNYFQSTTKLVTNFRSKVELEAYLDPMNLALLSTQFIEQNFIDDSKLPEALIAFIDLDLVYAMILNRDQISKVSLLLLKLVKYHIKKVQDNLKLFHDKPDLIQRLFTHGLLKTLISKITNFSSFKQNPRWLILLEIANQIMELKNQVFLQLGQEIALELGASEEMQKYFSAIHVLRDGTKFSSLMSKIKFATLLNHGDPQISHLATSYSTANKRFVANFEKKFGPEQCDWTFKVSKHTSSEFLQVQTDDGRQIMVDCSNRSSGAASSIIIRSGQNMTIKFPVKPQIVKWIGFLKARLGMQQKLMSLGGYDTIMQTAAISPVNVLGAQDHLTFVAADGSVYGMGGHLQYQQTPESECFRKIPFPEGISGADVKKLNVGKMGRVVLTNDGRLLYNGRNKYYIWGNSNYDHGQQQLDQFMEKGRDWFRNGDDKIVDIVSGCHYVVVLTEAGKIHCSGYRFYRNFDSTIRHNNENYEDWPFYLDAPAACWTKAIQVFPAHKNNTIYVNWKKDDGSIGSFRVGQSDQDDGGANGLWHQLTASSGGHFKKIVSVGYQVWGVCDKGNLWIWGKEIDDCIPKAEGVADCLTSRFFRDPVQFSWFTEKNLKILDVEAGAYFAIVLAQDSEGKKAFYGVGKIEHTFSNNRYSSNTPPTAEQQTVNRFGNNAKVLYGKAIFQIVDVDAEQVAAYAVTKNSVAYVLKGDKKQPPSIVPSKPEATGLIHFFKKDEVWNFVTAEEYEQNKDTLPRLSFATRHPIKDFNSKNFVDLSALDLLLTFSVEEDAVPEYYSNYQVSDDENEVKFVTATEKQALEGGCIQDLNPIIYIRASKPARNAKYVIPSIKLTDFFEQVQQEEAIAFNIVKTVVSDADLAQIEVRDEKSKVFLEEIKDFTSAQDNMIISQIDKLALSKSLTAITIKSSIIEPSEFTWAKDSALAKKDDSVLKLRCKLLLKLVKSWNTLESISGLQDKETAGTIDNMLFTYKYLVPPSVLSKIVDQACDQIYESSGTSCSVSRRKAFAFQESGKIDHEGKYSIFGQIIQQSSQERPDMSNFRIKSTDGKCYSIQFKGEGSIDAGGPFRESLTNIATELEKGVVPLLIRSPNNKNEHGTNRDCFILDSRSKTPAHKFMFKYFGGFLAYAFLSKSPIPFNLAPWVWKQLLQEQVTISDLDGIDAYSAQVLRDLKDHAQNLSDEHFDAGVDQYFTTILSTGEEVPLCAEGETIKVTKNNIDEFCQKVLEARMNEAKEQVEAIRLGFLTVIQNNEAILNFCDWETLERRCTGDKIISVERLKSITTFNVGSDHPIVARFWRVFEAFSEIEKRNYLKFVWGRCRLPVDLSNLSRKHEVRLFENLSNTGFPQSHTCFFQLDLPNYQTDEMMSKRLSSACELCGEIDTDNNAAQDLD